MKRFKKKECGRLSRKKKKIMKKNFEKDFDITLEKALNMNNYKGLPLEELLEAPALEFNRENYGKDGR